MDHRLAPSRLFERGSRTSIHQGKSMGRTGDWGATAILARYVLWDGTCVKSVRTEITHLAQCCYVMILIFYRSIRLPLAT